MDDGFNLRGLFAAFIAALVACSCSRPAPETVFDGVARVEGVLISEAQVRDGLVALRKRDPHREIIEADREAVLNELVDREALFAAACRAGWHTNAALVEAFQNTVIARYREGEFSKREPEPPAESEIRSVYERERDRFRLPAKVRAAIVQFEISPKAQPERVAAQIDWVEALRREAISPNGPGWNEIVRQHSVDQASRYRGGDLGWLSWAELESRIGTEARAAIDALADLSIEANGAADRVTEVVTTHRGPAFLKLLGRTAESSRPFEEVREQLSHEILRRRRQEVIDGIAGTARREATVEVNAVRLSTVPLPETTTGLPSLGGLRTGRESR